MKAVELRQLGDDQLALTLKEELKHLFHLRFQSATERLETPSEIKKSKRQVARILTVQRERQLTAAKAAAEQAAPKEATANG